MENKKIGDQPHTNFYCATKNFIRVNHDNLNCLLYKKEIKSDYYLFRKDATCYTKAEIPIYSIYEIQLLPKFSYISDLHHLYFRNLYIGFYDKSSLIKYKLLCE